MLAAEAKKKDLLSKIKWYVFMAYSVCITYVLQIHVKHNIH